MIRPDHTEITKMYILMTVYHMFSYAHITMCIYQMRNMKMYQDVTFRDHISTTQSMKLQKSLSKTSCIIECLNEGSCGSLFFRDGICAMYPSRMAAVYSVVSDEGWQFYHKDQRLCSSKTYLTEQYRYDSILDRCIRTSDDSGSYNYVIEQCNRENASLVRVDSPKMWQFVKNQMAAVGMYKSILQGKRDVNLVWRYDDKTKITYFNWKPGQPTRYDDEDFLLMVSSDGYRMHDTNGKGRKYGHVCEITMM